MQNRTLRLQEVMVKLSLTHDLISITFLWLKFPEIVLIKI